VDATANRELGDRFQVQGFPTLKFFRGGKATEYGGGRTEATIVSWVKKKSGPAAPTLATGDALAKFVKDNEVAVVGAFAEADGEAAAAFMAAAGASDDVPFALAKAEARSGLPELGSGSDDVVVLYKKFDDAKPVVFEGDATDAAVLGSWAAANSMPLVIPFSQAMAPRIFSGPIKTHFLLFVDADDEATADVLAAFRASAGVHRKTALHITVAPSEDRVLGYFDGKESDLPTAVLVNMPEDGAMKKFAMPKGADGKPELTADAFKGFVEAYVAGSLKPFLKSEPVPTGAAAYDGSVKVVVGKSFETDVLDPAKDVMVEFYAPWCGHCKALAPEFAKVGDRFKSVPTVSIAKFDATANEVDVDGVNVRGFPTLYFFPAGKSKKPVQYDGPRTAEGLEDFIIKNANTDFELPADGGAAIVADKDEL
jgi:protein disulfide-isomerase A1